MKLLLSVSLLFSVISSFCQSVGIGTVTPNAASSLDMGPSAKPVILPRLTTTQMNAVNSPAQGMLLYNTTEHQLYSYMRYRSTLVIGQSTNKWQPVTTGPRMIAWGFVDSFANERTGSANYSVLWDAENGWYTVTTTSHPFYKDSMMLMIQPVGNGSHDRVSSIGELIEGSARRATIKFVDVSMIAGGSTTLAQRRRSDFYFTLYDLRKEPY